jgi:hypothetical protein
MDECNLWSRIAQQLRSSCLSFDQQWMKRRRIFDTEALVTGLMHLVGGTQTSYAQAMDMLPLRGSTPTASSFCAARTKLAPFVIGEIRQDILEVWDEHHGGERWHGRRLHAVDGSKVSLPRPLFEYGFNAPKGGHCPQGLVSLLLRLDDRMVCDVRISKHANERLEAHEHLAHLAPGDLVIYDRGYFSFALLAAHAERGVDAVMRLADTRNSPEIRRFWRSQETDQIITLDPTPETYRKTRRHHPDLRLGPLRVRLIKYRIQRKTYVLATTVLDLGIQSDEFAKLYAQRWGAEEVFKSFKQTLSLDVFHAKTERGVAQEVEAIALLGNLTSILGSLAKPAIKKTQLPAQLHHSIKSTFSNVSARFAAA